MNEIIVSSIQEALKNSAISFIKWITLGVIKGSYIICLTAFIIALFIYIAGEKRAGKYCSISIVVFVILQAIKGLLI